MPLMKSIFRRPFRYAGVLVEPQAEFSVKSARDATLLTLTRRAALLAAAAPAVAPAPADPAAPAKRTYKRRDMVAEQPSVYVEPDAPWPRAPAAQAAAPACTWPACGCTRDLTEECAKGCTQHSSVASDAEPR